VTSFVFLVLNFGSLKVRDQKQVSQEASTLLTYIIDPTGEKGRVGGIEVGDRGFSMMNDTQYL
jgi:hypothetical protein